jgi:hypothetical protein
LKSVIGLTQTGLAGDFITVNALLNRVTQENIMAQLSGPNPAEGIAA